MQSQIRYLQRALVVLFIFEISRHNKGTDTHQPIEPTYIVLTLLKKKSDRDDHDNVNKTRIYRCERIPALCQSDTKEQHTEKTVLMRSKEDKDN